MRRTGSVVAIWVLVASGAVLETCSPEPPMRVCTPGTTQVCACAGGTSGVQSCTSDGEGYGTCSSCSAADAGAPQECVPGWTRSCACPGGTSGVQSCNDGGSGFAACQCSPRADAGTTGPDAAAQSPLVGRWQRQEQTSIYGETDAIQFADTGVWAEHFVIAYNQNSPGNPGCTQTIDSGGHWTANSTTLNRTIDLQRDSTTGCDDPANDRPLTDEGPASPTSEAYTVDATTLTIVDRVAGSISYTRF